MEGSVCRSVHGSDILLAQLDPDYGHDAVSYIRKWVCVSTWHQKCCIASIWTKFVKNNVKHHYTSGI